LSAALIYHAAVARLAALRGMTFEMTETIGFPSLTAMVGGGG
jgi:hypothetical protein